MPRLSPREAEVICWIRHPVVFSRLVYNHKDETTLDILDSGRPVHLGGHQPAQRYPEAG
jgi:hypothetical protein